MHSTFNHKRMTTNMSARARDETRGNDTELFYALKTKKPANKMRQYNSSNKKNKTTKRVSVANNFACYFVFRLHFSISSST